MEAEPDGPPAKLNAITSLVQSAFNTKDDIGDTMMVVVTYDNGTTKTVQGTIISDSSELTKSHGLGKEVTVSYSEGGITKDATFTIDVASYKFTETVQGVESGYTGTASTTSSPTVDNPVYKKFGDWPQTIKGAAVTVGSGKLSRGGLVYQVGTDGNYYVQAGNDYYKVEPIVWRVLTNDYEVPGENRELKSTGKALLLAENILASGIPYYVDTSRRTITGAGTKEGEPNIVYSNNYKYSTIRAWLNGKYEDDDPQEKSYTNTGFLQTAFTTEAQDLIALTTVDNTARSTNPDSNPSKWNSGKNEYACKNTTDKIFLLSVQEATKSDYGFEEYNKWGEGNTRIRVTTGYAKVTGAYQDSGAGYGGLWWLRSPDYYYSENYPIKACGIGYDGDALNLGNSVNSMKVGVVPALCIELQ